MLGCYYPISNKYGMHVAINLFQYSTNIIEILLQVSLKSSLVSLKASNKCIIVFGLTIFAEKKIFVVILVAAHSAAASKDPTLLQLLKILRKPQVYEHNCLLPRCIL
jgi:hypothetical protein